MTTPSKKPLKHSMRKSIYSSYDSLCSIGRKDSPVVPAAFSLLKTVQLGGSKESAQSAAVRKRKFVADAEDEDSSDSDPPRVLVRGQSITGLLPKEPLTTAKLRPMIFTNGEHVDLEHYLYSFVEGAAEKERAAKMFRSMRYAPSDSLIVASINCFSRKKKRHFFRDALYLCKVFANEMQMTLSCFLRVRGWLVANHGGVVKISYRRVGDCLRLLGIDAALNYYRVSAMFDRLFRALQNREVFPEMPYEASQIGMCPPFYLLLPKIGMTHKLISSSPLEINRPTCNDTSQQFPPTKQIRSDRDLDDDDDEEKEDDDEDDDEDDGAQHDDDDDNEDNNDDDDDEDDSDEDDEDEAFPTAALFEESQKKLSLPSKGRHELLDFHRKSSAFGKLITYQQTLQLGLNAVKASFSMVVHGVYADDDDFWEKLFSIIYYNCGGRRMMLVGTYPCLCQRLK
jgi:hypothetical protein